MAMLKFRAPPLPIAGPDYKQDYFAQLIRALGLYFNQLDSQTPVQWQEVTADYFNGGLFTGDGSGLTLPHVAASDTTDQYATASSTETKIRWNTLDSASGFELNADNTATALVQGIYKMTYSLQFVNTNNAAQLVWVWMEIDGVDVPRSTTKFSLAARKSSTDYTFIGAYSEVVFLANAGQKIALYWATDQAYSPSPLTDGVYMEYNPAETTPFAHPSVPSAIGSIVFLSALPTPNVTGVYASGYVGSVTVSTT